MSDHCFGMHRGHLTDEADEIAVRHGAVHCNYTEPYGQRRGWFACANRGEPFNGETAARVLKAINDAGGIQAFRKK